MSDWITIVAMFMLAIEHTVSDWITIVAMFMLAIEHAVVGSFAFRDWRRREHDGCGESIGWLLLFACVPCVGPVLYLLAQRSGPRRTAASAHRPVHGADSANDGPSTR